MSQSKDTARIAQKSWKAVYILVGATWLIALIALTLRITGIL